VWQTADHAVGYHLGTGFPGEPGNVVLSGHISHPTEGSVFRRLPEVKIGEGIILFSLGDTYLYQVVDIKVVPPSETSVMDPTQDETLTLITCVPDGVYSHRLIVVAKRR
jgi:LPXTG-site transpeptidase (sortase) family protein